MNNVKRRTIVGRHTVRHRIFEVERIEWKNTDRLSSTSTTSQPARC
jgi:hypothetical protein